MSLPEPYREWRSRLLPATMWTGSTTPGPATILPDGCMDLIWDGEQVMVAGPDSTARTFERRDVARLVGVRFDPGIAPSVLAVPAHRLLDERTDLAAVWSDAEHRRWGDLLATASSPTAVLERLALDRLAAGEQVPAWVPPAVALLDRGATVSELADRVGYTPRHLGRLAQERFGYGPKVLARILRLGRALELLRRGDDLTRVAVTAGYADYSHLSREVRALTGATPSAFQPDSASAA